MGPGDTDTQGAADNAYVENLSNDMDNIGDQAGSSNAGTNLSTYRNGEPKNSILSTCAMVHMYSAFASDPDTLLVDFGNTNCVCSDGKVRNGQIRYVFPAGAHYRDSGIVITVTPVNYFVEGNQVSGSKTITNRGRVSGGNLQWDITANLTVVRTGGAGTITWSSTRQKVLLNTSTVISGSIVPDWTQARIGITGSGNGTTANGNTYTMVITNQLVRDFSCSPNSSIPHKHPFIQGTFEYTPNGRLTRTIDFGPGTCDLDATVSVGGHPFNITL
jgi:hypothetical protein